MIGVPTAFTELCEPLGGAAVSLKIQLLGLSKGLHESYDALKELESIVEELEASRK